MSLRLLPLGAVLCLAVTPLFAQSPPLNPPSGPGPVPAAPEAFKEVSPGVLQLGLVTVEPKQRLIKLSAVVNLKDGSLDYALIGSTGKAQGSLLVTKAIPDHIQQAMVYLGFKEASAPSPTPMVSNPELAIAPVSLHITLQWIADGKPQEAPLENWILNNKTQEPMAIGDWIYNGMRTAANPSVSGSEPVLISLVSDPTALIVNPRPDKGNQSVWKSRSEVVPEVGTQVEIHLQWIETQTANLPPQPNESLMPGTSTNTPPPVPAQ